MDDTRDSREGGRWMTYTELARTRAISKESAIRLARRERWRKLPGNDIGGMVRVLVPEDWLRPAREEPPPVNPTAIREGIPEDLRHLTAGWEQAIVFSRIRAEEAEARADRAERRAAAAEQGRDQADADRRTAEARAEKARVEAQAADARTDQVRQQLEELRQAEAERKGRGRLRRAWDSWRGR